MDTPACHRVVLAIPAAPSRIRAEGPSDTDPMNDLTRASSLSRPTMGSGVYLTSRHGSWRLRSVVHLTERHGEFIILAIGESVVAIGVGAAQQPISTPLLLAAILSVAAAVGLWWLYFDVASLAAEHRLLVAHGQARARLALEAYTYVHLPIVAGIVLAALGIEGVLAHAGDGKPLGAFSASALFGGVAL
jgi:low temperature requirement protein LtrA